MCGTLLYTEVEQRFFNKKVFISPRGRTTFQTQLKSDLWEYDFERNDYIGSIEF